MAMMLFSERTEKDTILTRLNPLTKLLGLLVISILITSDNPILMAFSMLFVAILAIYVKLPVINYLRGTPALIILIAFIFISDLLIQRSLEIAITEASSFFFLIMLSSLFMDSTSPDDTANSLGKLLSPIFGKGAWSFASAIMLTLTMLSHIFTASREMLDARRSRGGSFLKHPIGNLYEYVYSLFIHLFDDMKEMDLALRSRLYDEKAERIALPYRSIDALICIILTAIYIGYVIIF